MGNYSVPEEIRKMRPQGTMVKKVKNRYYVYEYTSTSVKTEMPDGTFRWKTQSKTGACIGQITLEDGFVRNGIKMSDTDNTVLEFGSYFLIKEFAGETYQRLASAFNPEDAKQIFAVAAILVAERFEHMERIADVFPETVLAKWYPDVHLGKDALDTVFRTLGKYGTKPEEFGQKLIDESSGKVALTSHAMNGSAETGGLSVFGYDALSGTAQMNRITAYDAESQVPLCNELFSDPDKTAAEGLLDRFSFADTLFLADRSFNTAQDKALFSQNGNTYIVPMVDGRDDYQSVYEVLRFDDSKTFVYEKDGYSSLIYYNTYEIEGYPVDYHVFLDTARQSAERQMYIRKMQSGAEGYSEEGLAAAEKDFGLFLLETNDMNKTAEDVFRDYQSLGDVETFCRNMDCNPDFLARCRRDNGNLQGMGFIMQIAEMIVHDIQATLKPHHLSAEDVLFALRGLKLVKERKRYVVRNENDERRQLCETIHLNTSNHGVNN